jgi:hypothetical protein
MVRPPIAPEEISQRGHALYEHRLRSVVEPGNVGRYVVFDVETGDYEVGDAYLPLAEALHQRRPDAPLMTMKIGYRTAGRIGGPLRRSTSDQHSGPRNRVQPPGMSVMEGSRLSIDVRDEGAVAIEPLP